MRPDGVAELLSCARRTAFRHRVAVHAASGALRDLLEARGLSYGADPLAEGTVFGLAGGFALRVRVAAGAVPALDLDGHAGALEEHLCHHLGLEARMVRTDDPALAWERLRAELDAGRPTLVRVDAGALPYGDTGRHDTRHVVVVLGHDAAAGTVTVADPRHVEPWVCRTEELAHARAADAWPSAVHHAQLSITGSALAPPQKAVVAALQRTVAGMRDPDPPLHPHLHIGLAAADILAHAWPELPELAGDLLGETLQAVARRIADPSTGGTLHRSQQTRFEHDAAAMLGRKSLSAAALTCDDLADAWRSLGGALADPDARRAHTVAEPWVRRVRDLEHRHVEALEDCLHDLAIARS